MGTLKNLVCYCVFVATHGTSISSTHPVGKGPRTPLIFPGPSRHLPSHSPKLPTRLVPAMDRRCLRVRRTPAAAARPQAAKPAPAGWSGKKQKGWPCSTFVHIARFLLQASLYDSLNCLGIFEQSQLARGNVFCMFYLQASQTALSLSLSLSVTCFPSSGMILVEESSGSGICLTPWKMMIFTLNKCKFEGSPPVRVCLWSRENPIRNEEIWRPLMPL